MLLEKARFVLGQIAHGMIRPQKEINEAVDTVFSELDKRIWIPVSEKLPEKEVEVLITTSWDNVCIAWCDNGKWRAEYINEYDDNDILAWMPLPEPYVEVNK